MKKRAFLFVPLVLGLLATGCGGKETPQDNKQNENQPSGNSQTTQYTITFKDENGNVLESKKWDEGTTPSYSYEKPDTAEWDYSVLGWSATEGGELITIPSASSDATYFAIVSAIKQ